MPAQDRQGRAQGRVPCLLQAMSSAGAFLSTVPSTSTWYRNSATSFTSLWKATLSTTNTMALGQQGTTGAGLKLCCHPPLKAFQPGLRFPQQVRSVCWLKYSTHGQLLQELLPCPSPGMSHVPQTSLVHWLCLLVSYQHREGGNSWCDLWDCQELGLYDP